MNGDQSELDGLSALDPNVLTAIHNRYYPDVYRYIGYRVSDPAVVEDITSEVFLRLLEAVNSRRGPRTTVRGWLIGTAANLINDHYRQAYSRSAEKVTESLYSEASNPALLTEEQERIAYVQDALAQLTPEQQHVLALRFGSGYSLEDVAALMGKKTNAIKALQFRALASLRRLLEEP